MTILPRMQNWQISLKNVVSDPIELCRLLALDSNALSDFYPAMASFALRVPREFIARMEKGNPNDPLLLQVLPQAQEILEKSQFIEDPLQEKKFNPLPGLLHKYAGRVLLILQGACAINCRYCFRRHFPYEENLPGTSNWPKILNYIAEDSSIEEVIFNGGDPLLMKDSQLAKLAQEIEKIPHVKILRFHTRVPIVIPSRINEEFLAWMKPLRLQKIIVVHTNHPNEIDDDVKNVFARLRKNGITLLNQSVLLKGVNDDPEILIALSRKLFESQVMPYYLHALDAVAGAAHFDLDLKRAEEILREVRNQLPGYLVPKFVREIPGEKSKTAI